jgi:hypothetical protein
MLTFTAPAIDIPRLPQAVLDFITNEETGGKAYYEKTEMHPDWPGGASGVTIGDGFDCGYSAADTIRRVWGPHLGPSAVEALAAVAGIKGRPAASHAAELHWITVSWDAAIAVFTEVDVPEWTGHVVADLPNSSLLSGVSLGALVSLAFNRGRSWNISAENDPAGRYAEMRAIKAHMASQNFSRIPGEILAMRRLWPEGGDLWRRRGHEAALFTQGLGAPVAVPQPAAPAPAPSAAAAPHAAPAPRPAAAARPRVLPDRNATEA